jgi:hypothetical protein
VYTYALPGPGKRIAARLLGENFDCQREIVILEEATWFTGGIFCGKGRWEPLHF